MDIAAASSALSQVSLSQQASIAVTKKVMDTATQNSQALVQMMERSINPNLGGNFDAKI